MSERGGGGRREKREKKREREGEREKEKESERGREGGREHTTHQSESWLKSPTDSELVQAVCLL